MGKQPQPPLNPDEKTTPGTWVVCWEVRYDIWDVRRPQDNRLVFMVVSDPESGAIIENMSIMSRAYAVRLVIEMANVVQEINQASEQAKAIAKLSDMFTEALDVVGLGEELRSELERAETLVKENAEVAIMLVEVSDSVAEDAENLLSTKSDKAAERFLTELAWTLGSMLDVDFASSREIAMAVLIIESLRMIELPMDQWINTLYYKITNGQTPLLEAFTQTYGQFEVRNTLSHLEQREQSSN